MLQSIIFFFLVSGHLLYHVFPVVGAGERSSIWFGQVISVILASVGVVSSTSVVSRKLLLELSRFWAAECSWSEWRLSLACFVRSAFVMTALRMPERA
ncbi:hypothetical protein SKAU_G00410360 [Synaphobranchus kaupii]|uniref:Uncharacterized protein n=1 Tax=Synaphobranchus kaupii TaxID=118154 RepID=A0A9Q1E7M6_SYNKA|nr:hypothetical protein SKAU_G00410360 [Synaphobranchus kaupii]